MTVTAAPPRQDPAPPARTHGPGAGLLIAAALLVAVACIASGTMSLVSLLWLRSDTSTQHLARAATVEVHQGCGGLTVREADQTSVTLTTKVWMTFDRPTITTTRDGSTLVIRSKCQAFTWGGISGSSSLTLVVPTGTALDLHSDGGIRLVGTSGTTTAHSSSGSVRGDGLRSASVTATSTDAAVALRFGLAPTTVVATSTDGSVTVSVPDDGTAYAVDASSTDGSTHVDIATDPKSSRSITAHSSDGSVRIAWL